MTDAQAQPTPPVPAPVATDENRVLALIVYCLYLAAVFSAGLAGVAGVIVAYIKRGEARGTIWEGHFDNQIGAFWIWLALFFAGVMTWWVLGFGFVLMGLAFIYFLYRTIKGLILAIDSKPYV
jgi:uncharacterized membrane protein